MVRSRDVCLPEDPWCKLIFLDVPNEMFLPSLLSSEMQYRKSINEIRNIQNEEGKEEAEVELPVIVHFTPQHIIDNPLYQKFCQSIKTEDTTHIYVNGSNNQLFSGFLSAQSVQYRLNQLNSKIFPILKESEEIIKLKNNREQNVDDKVMDNTKAENTEPEEKDGQYINFPMGTMTHFKLRGKKGKSILQLDSNLSVRN